MPPPVDFGALASEIVRWMRQTPFGRPSTLRGGLARLAEAMGGVAPLAETLGVARQTLTRWNRDETHPAPHHALLLQVLADAHGIAIEHRLTHWGKINRELTPQPIRPVQPRDPATPHRGRPRELTSSLGALADAVGGTVALTRTVGTTRMNLSLWDQGATPSIGHRMILAALAAQHGVRLDDRYAVPPEYQARLTALARQSA